MHLLCKENGVYLFHFYKNRTDGLKAMKEILFRKNRIRAEIVMMLVEIVKNIYDHCPTGEGYLLFLDKKEEIIFIAWDTNIKPVKLNYSNGDEWFKKTKNNFGVGLGLMDGTVKAFPKLTLIRSTKKGVSYFGRMYSSKNHPIKYLSN